MSIPELRRRGYDERMSVGTLAGSGTLGLLIPPRRALEDQWPPPARGSSIFPQVLAPTPKNTSQSPFSTWRRPLKKS